MIPKTSLGTSAMYTAAPRPGIRFGHTQTFNQVLDEAMLLVRWVDDYGTDDDRQKAATMLSKISPRDLNPIQLLTGKSQPDSRFFEALTAQAPRVRTLMARLKKGLSDEGTMVERNRLLEQTQTGRGHVSRLAGTLLRLLRHQYRDA